MTSFLAWRHWASAFYWSLVRQSASDGAVDYLVGTLLGEIMQYGKGINTLVSKPSS